MMNNRIIRRACRWGISAGLTGATFVAATVTGVDSTEIHAGELTEVRLLAGGSGLLSGLGDLLPKPDVLLDKLGLVDLLPKPGPMLDIAIKNLTDASDVLHNVHLSDDVFSSFLGSQIATQGGAVTSLGQFQATEHMISDDDPTLKELFQLYQLNLKFILHSYSVLFWDHAFAGTVAADFPGLTAMVNHRLFDVDLKIFGNTLSAFGIQLNNMMKGLEAPPSTTDSGSSAHDDAAPAAAVSAVAPHDGAEPAAALPAAALPGLPTLTPQIPDPFLELVQKIDAFAFTPYTVLGINTGELENHDIVGTVAMQINEGLTANQVFNSLGINLIASQILAGDWKSALPVTTDFFEEFVTKTMNPDAFTADGLPADPGNPIETIAHQLDDLLTNTVYATDLNAAALVLWP